MSALLPSVRVWKSRCVGVRKPDWEEKHTCVRGMGVAVGEYICIPIYVWNFLFLPFDKIKAVLVLDGLWDNM
jgi:hypothetical protein